MSKAQRNKARNACRECGATTNHGKAWCALHHPKAKVTAHVDKYTRART